MKRTIQLVVQNIISKRSSSRGAVRPRLPFEVLESRVLLSGSILAKVSHGSLNVRGGAAANVVALDQTGLSAGQVRVSGANGTTINKQAGPVVLSGVTRGIHVALGKGNDAITLSDVSAPGGVFIDSGAGTSSIRLTDVTVQRNTHIISGGKGAAVITVDDSTFHGATSIVTGRGADLVQLDSNGDTVGAATVFGGPIFVALGRGDDVLQVGVGSQTGNQSQFNGSVNFSGGTGHDSLLNFSNSAHNGSSRVRIVGFETRAAGVDVTAPTVRSTSPAASATAVASNGAITATFSEAMDPASLTPNTVIVTPAGSAPVLGTVTTTGNTVTFTPTSVLSDSTVYTVRITTGATDVAGNPLASDYVWTFTTGVTPDTTAPVVSSTDPADHDTAVSRNRKIAVTFSERIDPTTLTGATVTVTAPGPVAVSGTLAYLGTTLTFTPTSPLAANTLFTATITTGVKDLAGNALARNFVWSFTTGATSDTTAPTVSSTDPTNTAAGVALNKKIAATFSEAMDPATLTTSTFTVSAPGQSTVVGTVSYVNRIATFTPGSALSANTTYTVTIKTGATDLAGNGLAGNFVYTFTTGATADTTAPTVTATDPANNGTGVALNKKFAATFSEAMDPSTITAANVTVTGPGTTAVAGSVAYVGTTMTFTPTSNLAANTAFTVTISTGAKDLAGNRLASDFVAHFTTGATPDTTPPTVTLTSPANNQTNVVINKTIASTFSESMDALTITTADFTLTDAGNNPVAGTVNYDSVNDIASFVPNSNLAPNATYTATVIGGSNGVKDLAGNALVSNKVWTFTTGTQVAQAPINLGAASTFAVMATASISGTGATQINGDVGLNPGTAQGIPPAEVNGTIHVDDQAIITAQSDLRSAYNDAVSRSVTSQSLPGNMGGLTFTPGLYTNSTSVLIQGAGPANNVTLDAQGDPNAIFIFQMGSTLTTGPGAQVILAGGAKASNIFWQVGTSATLNTTTIFKGNVLAAVTITVNSGSTVEGRLLAGSSSDGSVTVNASTVTVPTS